MRLFLTGSPGRIRTSNLLLTEPLLLPKGLDYLMSDQKIETRVYSLYTFLLARDNPDITSGVPRISPIFQSVLLRKAAFLTGSRSTVELQGNIKERKHYTIDVWRIPPT